MNILGISAYYHDSAAALLTDGVIAAAAQEERFSRKKHDASFPALAIEWCLDEAKIGVADLDLVVFYDKPLLKFLRILETHLWEAPRGFGLFRRALPVWLRQKLHTRRELRRSLGPAFRGRILFTSHHESHAASAFFASPFERAAILTLDGVGEWACGSIGTGHGNKIELLQELHFPHSLGLLYSAFTYFTGFEVNGGEYKMMGLSPYGEPKYRDLILKELVEVKPDGSFRLNMKYFAYCHDVVMTGPEMDRLFGGPPRSPESAITQREMDLAASIQAVTEELVLRIAAHTRERTGCGKLVMAGGVALNCVANGKLLRSGLFDEIWIQPAAGDAGAALGAALHVWHHLLDRPRAEGAGERQRGSLLGPRFSKEEVAAYLSEQGARFEHFDDPDTLSREIARWLDAGEVVGHFAGAMEFGPRALGNRSIIADPRSGSMQATLNQKTKGRESFRPFAAAVLEEHVTDYFEFEGRSPYMLMVGSLRPTRRIAPDRDLRGLERLGQARSLVPGVTHVDYSTRLQTVSKADNPRFRRIIEAFYERTGCPMIINTSFNIRDEPIVCSPQDAYRCFMATGIDVLVLEDFVVTKPVTARGAAAITPETDVHRSRTEASFVELNLRPDIKALRQFGAAAAVVLAALAFGVAGGLAPSTRTGAAVAAAVSVMSTLVGPRLLRAPFVALSVLTYPIGLVVSHVVLVLLYLGILTPAGLLLRLLGSYDPLSLRDDACESYWRDAPPAKPTASYLRQF